MLTADGFHWDGHKASDVESGVKDEAHWGLPQCTTDTELTEKTLPSLSAEVFFFFFLYLVPLYIYKKSFSLLRITLQSLLCQKMVIAHLRVICILRGK